MRQRWVPVAVLAAVLFAINMVARLVVRIGFDRNETVEDRASLVMFAVIGALLAVVAFVSARRHPVGRWAGDLVAAVLPAMLLTILVGPFISGGQPFAGGAGEFFSQVWLYSGFALGGALLGFWVAIALGLDYRSQTLKRFEQSKLAKPRRVVRR
jgi:hypothetical protein